MSISRHLQKLEEQLLQPITRKSTTDVNLLLADEFIEFGSSGDIFNKQQVLEYLKVESQVYRTLWNFKTVQLAQDVVLVTYTIIQNTTLEEKIIYSLRSSVWRIIDGHWKMIFHQGTPSMHGPCT